MFVSWPVCNNEFFFLPAAKSCVFLPVPAVEYLSCLVQNDLCAETVAFLFLPFTYSQLKVSIFSALLKIYLILRVWFTNCDSGQSRHSANMSVKRTSTHLSSLLWWRCDRRASSALFRVSLPQFHLSTLSTPAPPWSLSSLLPPSRTWWPVAAGAVYVDCSGGGARSQPQPSFEGSADLLLQCLCEGNPEKRVLMSGLECTAGFCFCLFVLQHVKAAYGTGHVDSSLLLSIRIYSIYIFRPSIVIRYQRQIQRSVNWCKPNQLLVNH